MKAITLDGFGDTSHIGWRELNAPETKPGEVLVDLKASAFNPIDHQMRRGLRESALLNSPVLGIEFSGIVAHADSAVTFLKPGDRVMGISLGTGSNGSYAEQMAISPDELVLIPEGMDFETASSIPSSAVTAWQCFQRMKSEESSRIFITGASGGVGRFLVLLLLAHGRRKIVVTAGNEQSIEVLEKLGLPTGRIISYRSSNCEEQVLAANDGLGFDYSVDLVGGTMAETAARVLKPIGTYVDVTFLGTALSRETLFDHACGIINICAYPGVSHRAALIDFLKIIPAATMDAANVHVVGDLSVATVAEAHRLMEANQTYGKKLVMRIGSVG